MKTNHGLESHVQKYIENHPNTSLSEVVQHFVAIGCSRASVYRWAKSAQQPRQRGRIPRRRYTARIATKGNVQKLTRFFNHRSGRDGTIKPFLSSKYRGGGYVFWPDLASSHYAHSVQDYLTSKGIPYVPRDINPANVPKARPIEDFWGNLKAKVYEGDWKAKSLEELKRRIEYCLKNLDQELVKKHTLGVRTRLGRIVRNGIP